MSVDAMAMSLSTIVVAVNAQLLRGLWIGNDALPATSPQEKAAAAFA